MKANPPPCGPALLHQTPAGPIVIVENGAAVTHVFFRRLMQPEHVEWKETPLLRRTARQLDEYFQGTRRTFDVPLSPQGTEFEQTVWRALQTIPHGETRSYGDIARQIGRPSACRAVGHANNQNPIGIIIPCHRVIGASGKLTGYAGGLTIKQYLLELEQGAVAPFMLFPDAERMLWDIPAGS
ncbi:cysteine methyltransferase [Akkermansia muciniphila]|jgi:methylated-DNA-[protein]-cysteine S-methyltransferase|uniref:Methylated-DNA--protein-cysteine methyltransferase n=1 Tax=Akkermansia muciniphila TaxID=239935 RepID=A0A2N8HFD2_9BACT|nr:methylated-DNA--[protein]-cysteine S-methyltransferase [Akkermansia muciniphila]PNC18979.1 cysteine methyltransferase [Akkermansia muciniphila]